MCAMRDGFEKIKTTEDTEDTEWMPLQLGSPL